MKKKKPWFAFYAADFMDDEKVATMSERACGVYIRMLARAWQSDDPGTLPSDPQKIIRMISTTEAIWQEVEQSVMRCWVVKGDRIHQPRMVEEWSRVCRISKSKAVGGHAKAKKHRESAASSVHSSCIESANADGMQTYDCDCSSSSPDSSSGGGSLRGEGENPGAGATYLAQGEIAEWWARIPSNRRRGLGRVRVVWAAARAQGATAALLGQSLVDYYQSEEGKGRYYRSALKFLEDEGWLEDPSCWVDRDKQPEDGAWDGVVTPEMNADIERQAKQMEDFNRRYRR